MACFIVTLIAWTTWTVSGLSLPRDQMSSSPSDALEAVQSVLVDFIRLNDAQTLQAPKAQKLFSGEARQWKTPSFGRLASSPDKVVLITESSAVGRIQWYGENEQVTDLYFYLANEGGRWKITAMRTLALTGIPEDIFLNLKAKKQRTEEEENTFRNLELVLAPDSKLRQWFVQNREALDRLCNLARTSGSQESPDVKALVQHLHLGSVEKQQDGTILVVIGGVLDNTVGFLFSPINKPPRIDPSNYIWVEQVTEGWFLFRTT